MISQKHIKDSERKYVKIVNCSGFAQRIAGSGCSQYGVCDVISCEDGQVYLDEVKSTSQEKLIVDSKMKEQLEKLIETARLNPPLKPRLVIHWKRRGWQIVNLDEIPKSPIEMEV
jgi:Holliday junction resolvase